MCLGCKMRERMMRRTHQRLAKLEARLGAEFERARRDLHDIVVDTAGPFAEPPPAEPPGTQLKLAV